MVKKCLLDSNGTHGSSSPQFHIIFWWWPRQVTGYKMNLEESHILRCLQKSSRLDLQVTNVILVSGTQFVWHTIFTSAKITHSAQQRGQGSKHIILSRMKALQEGSHQIRVRWGDTPEVWRLGKDSIKSAFPEIDKSELMLSRWCLQLQGWGVGGGYRCHRKYTQVEEESWNGNGIDSFFIKAPLSPSFQNVATVLIVISFIGYEPFTYIIFNFYNTLQGEPYYYPHLQKRKPTMTVT